MKNDNTIFVQVASYRDPQLIPTLLDMIDSSNNPELLHIGVCWQHADDEKVKHFEDVGFTTNNKRTVNKKVAGDVIKLEYKGAKVSMIDIHFHKTNGTCWARNQVQQLYKKEKYTLQLDSHHRFTKGWDTILIDMLESIREECEFKKPLLTAYIPSFDPDKDPEKRVNEAWKMDFDRFIPEGAVFFLPSTIDGWQNLDKPVKSRFFSAHFCFADGKFAEEVQHDPLYFFHGEEISIAVRAFTHGYDLYHPHRPVVWHEYTRKGRVKVWDDHTTGQKNKGRVELDWVERNNISHRRNRILFGMDGEDPTIIDFGIYGFGELRTLRQYEEYAGICFKYRGVQQKTLDREYPPNNFEYSTEEEWINSLAISNDIRICVHKSEVDDEFLDDYDFCFVGAHDAEGNELYRKDLTGEEFYKKLEHDWLDYRFIFLSTKLPVTYTVWPHSTSKGWRKKIDKSAQEQ